MRRILLVVSPLGLLNFIAKVALAQRIWVSAQAQDYQSKQFLTAGWEWSDSTGQVIARQRTSNTGFSGIVSERARFLRVVSNGYRSMRLPVQWPRVWPDSVSFRVVIPLISIDKPIANQPYSQSEQRPLQLTTSAAGDTRIPVKFTISDALTNRPVKANVCLFFTSTHKQCCYDGSSLTAELIPQDIVAIEVRATGYQTYLGNISTANLVSDATRSYRIQLNPTPTILMASMPEVPPNATLKQLHMQKNYSLIPVDRSHFFVLAKPGIYELVGTVGKDQVTTDTLYLAEGLNAYNRSSMLARPIPGYPQESTIYFAQSSYMLSDSAGQQLNRIAHIMKQNSQLKLKIVGHTDSIGNAQLNYTLSEFRAKITKAYLVRRGIQEGRITPIAAGAGLPTISNDTEENRRKNRRATLLLH